MAYCEFCPLKEACLQIDDYLGNHRYYDGSEIDNNERQVIEAARTILSIEGTAFSNPCPDRLPLVSHEEVDGSVNYLLICSDSDRQGIAEYLLSFSIPVGGEPISEDEFEKLYPWISLVERLKEQ